MARENVKVIFRKYPEGDIIAMFPEIPADNIGFQCLSYMHVGQHGGGDCAGIMRATKAAKPDEYRDLKRELEFVGYDLDVVEKMTPAMRKRRRDEADRRYRR